MPELPEVETVVRTLRPRLSGRTIESLELRSPKLQRLDAAMGLAERVRGFHIDSVERHGKYIVLRSSHSLLLIHLRMTGKLLADVPPTSYTRAVFCLNDGHVVFDDTRMFGTIEWSEHLPDRLTLLGPDPTEIPFAEFFQTLRSKRSMIKPLLLNQQFLRGMGNIYTDEALFLARIHPRTPTSRIGEQRARALHQEMVALLARAIEAGGSSISDYVDAEGRRGWFQLNHNVYDRAGEPCRRCGTPIKRIVVAQRGTHFCPRCQRR